MQKEGEDMGFIIWPILMIGVFGYRYIIKWYEENKSQYMKLLCIAGLVASGFILIYWGFTLGMIAAGTIQIVMNMVKYKNDPVKLEEELGTEFTFGTQDVIELVLMMAIMAVICIVAFKAMKSYLKVVRPNATGLFFNRRIPPDNPSIHNKKPGRPTDQATEEKKPKRISSVFCPKCGSRITEGAVECSRCGRKLKKNE